MASKAWKSPQNITEKMAIGRDYEQDDDTSNTSGLPSSTQKAGIYDMLQEHCYYC